MAPSNVEPRDGSSLRIFISYRRDDTQQAAGRLYDRLADAFGEENVLKDVDSIPFGVDFREYSTRLVKESDVVLILIGPHWVGERSDGARRIDHEADLVRLEVEAALQQCLLVIPVLVGDAAMPAPSELPASLASLPFRNAARLRHDPDFRVDSRRLVEQLERLQRPPASIAASELGSLGESVADDRSSSLPFGPSDSEIRPGAVREFGDPSIGFCWCPPGEFLMEDREGKPTVAVALTRGFWLSRTVVTQGHWWALMQTQPWRQISLVPEGADYPVVLVDWGHAMRFCATLTQKERNAGRLSWDWAYALPTEAQWEYACRAGTTTRYCFGDDDGRLAEYAWFDRNARHVGAEHIHPVAKKKPNAWGLCDMHGNVWEWCRDVYAEVLPGGRDPQASQSSERRVVRGGSWYETPKRAASAFRYQYDHFAEITHLGFRVACVSVV